MMRIFIQYILFLSVFLCASMANAASVYEELSRAFEKMPHRLPGSSEYYQAFDDLEAVLKRNGIEPKRQTFRTYVPEYSKLSLTIDGKPYQINAISPNNTALITTGGELIKAPLVSITREALSAKKYAVKGKIVLLNWGVTDIRELFSEGAKAVIFIGNPDASQWNIAGLQSPFNVSRPLFYLSKEEAEKAGISIGFDSTPRPDPKKAGAFLPAPMAELQASAKWKTVEGINLWFELKPFDAKEFQLGRQEAIMLGARVDTFGSVPGEVRGDRDAANCALLADIAVRLSKEKLDRAVFCVFYGGTYNAFDGLRHFFFGVSPKNSQDGYPNLNSYQSGFQEELARADQLLEVFRKGPVVKKENDLEYEARMLLRDAVVNYDGAVNYQLGDINLALRKNPTPELAQRRDELEKEKTLVSELRRQINEQKLEPGSEKIATKFIQEISSRIEKRKAELEIQLKDGECLLEIAKSTNPYVLLAAYYFDFSSADQPFVPVCRGYEMPHTLYKVSTNLYTKYFKALKEVVSPLKIQTSKSPMLLSALSVDFEPVALTSQSLLALPAAAGLSISLPGFSFRSIPGFCDYDELPGVFSFDLEPLASPVQELITAIAQAPDLSLRSTIQESVLLNKTLYYSFKNGKYDGSRFDLLAPGGKEVVGPASGAFAFVGPVPWGRMPTLTGHSLYAFGKINQFGYTSMPMLTICGSWRNGELDTNNGGAIDFDETGKITHINDPKSFNKLYRCYGGVLSLTFAPFTFNFAGGLTVVNGMTDGAYTNVNTFGRLDPGDGFFLINKNAKSKIVTMEETFVLGSTSEKPTGSGIDINSSDLLNLNISGIAINDTILLNLERLEKLHNRNIYNSVIELYQDKAERHKEDAALTRSQKNVGQARGHEIFGQSLAVRAYRPLKKSIDDMIHSVIILLIMTIPFAFVLERLLVGCTNIYRQLAWGFVFFIGTFLGLYFTHPAFSLAQTPMIIFIAFFIIMMSAVVIYIVMNRFKSELMAFQGLDTSAHRVSSENNMVLAAVLIGVSSMRNRPVKTFLTILTVVLLTFTIISFASFESTGMVKPTYMGDSSGEPRIESFQATHLDMTPSACDAAKDLYLDRYHVFFRAASYYSPYYVGNWFATHENVLYNPLNNKTLKLEAVAGFEQGEAKHSSTLAKLMPGFADYQIGPNNPPPVYLSQFVAKELDLKVGDLVYIRSKKMRLAGIFQSAELENASYLDKGKLAPPNFNATSNAEDKSIWKVVFDTNNIDASSFIWSSADLTALTDIDTTYVLNGFRNGVILYPKTEEIDLMKDANDIAEVSYGIVYSNSANGIHRHFFTESFSASGVGNIIVPLLLGGLIILSSLLGSIADREKEIFTFSALGLSPKDVSILFFAESSVYAIIGGLGGYLLSQIVSALLRVLAGFGLIQAPDMNYSSLSTVYTILIVMLTVLLSTIYPAIKAGRAANPGVARRWKMPAPVGNKLQFQFPFTVSKVDFGGILMFIKEHFDNHSDSSLGTFAASNTAVMKKNGDPIFSSELTLAPFDLGVSEIFKMYSASSDIPGIDVVTIEISKLDGATSAWIRANQRFVDEIRNQFLLWRSLPIETVVHYRTMAEALLEHQNQEK